MLSEQFRGSEASNNELAKASICENAPPGQTMGEKQPGPRIYGCLFCVTGCEEEIAERINNRTVFKAFAPTKLRFHRKKGVKTVKASRIFPGYVFFTADHQDISVAVLETIDGVIRLLKYDNQEWNLRGSDAVIVDQLYEYGGVIGFSKGRFVDGKLTIKQGFLKRFETDICGVDRRHHAAKIRMKLNNKPIEVWFGYEIDEDDDQSEAGMSSLKPGHEQDE